MKLNLICFIIGIMITVAPVFAQQPAPVIEWQKSFGGSKGDSVISIEQTRDGGYITIGFSSSNDGDVSGNHINGVNTTSDYWVAKISKFGDIEWQRSYGGTGIEHGFSIKQTKDDGYILAGYSTSHDGDVSGNNGGEDYWIVKLNETGNIDWQRNYGGSEDDEAVSIAQTIDGGYIVAGWEHSNDGDVSNNHGNGDYWIIKINNLGDIEWQKCLGGTEDDVYPFIQVTKDSGYIIAGSTVSNNGDVTGQHGGADSWVVKLTKEGIIEWQKCLGGTDFEDAYSVQQTEDGGYIVASYTYSNDGDVSGNHGSGDYWIVKLDSAGTTQWQKTLGGSGDEIPFSIGQTYDGGYIVAGYSTSSDGDVSGNKGDYDYWITKLNVAGNIQWQKNYGGSALDNPWTIRQTTDRGYIVAGWSNSNDGDVSGNHGDIDYWIVKLSGETPLPITLLNFAGQLKSGNVLLKWKTVSDIASSVFEIEKSTDGINFASIKQIQAYGRVDVTSDYNFEDKSSASQGFAKLYYRLKIINHDGSFTFSKVISINIELRSAFTIMPNPAKNFITITGANLTKIQLFDITGKLVVSKMLYGDSENRVDISRLSSSSYVILLTNKQGQIQTKKIIIR